MDEAERKQRLEQAVREAVEKQRTRNAEDTAAALKPGRRRQWVMAVLLLVSWSGIAYIWVARPEFLFGPNAREWNQVRHEASLRFGMVLLHDRIEDFVDDNGKLPTSSGQVGPLEEGITWERADTDYTIIGRDSTITLRLNRSMAVDSFLGNAIDILRRNP